MTFFTEIKNKNLKIHSEALKIPDSQRSPEHKEQCWRDYIPDFKLYCSIVVIKTAWS